MGGPHTRLKLFLPERSRVCLPQTGTALGPGAQGGRRRDGVVPSLGVGGTHLAPVLCPRPEHALDILVGVGLGCLLQMTSSQLVVKVRLR